jgi:DNA gyrase inhibitor GyrI
MQTETVRMVTLAPMRVASFLGFSQHPEMDAWKMMVEWARPRQLFETPGTRVFGFNNPDPSEGSPNYGYEFWITIADDLDPGPQVEVKDFSGGLYAVMGCSGKAEEVIWQTWQKLIAWRENSRYRMGQHQWLEEHLRLEYGPIEELKLDLYMPVQE